MLCRAGVLFILIFLSLFCGLASASAVYQPPSYDRIYISNEPATNYRDLAWLETTLNNTSLVSHSGSTYYINRTIIMDSNSVLYINGSTASKLIMPTSAKLAYGYNYQIHDIEIEGGGELSAMQVFHDVYRHDGGSFRLSGGTGVFEDIYNITIENCSSGIKFYTHHDYNIYNVTVKNTTSTTSNSALLFYDCYNMDVGHVYTENIGDYTSPTTGIYSVCFEEYSTNLSTAGCKNITAHDLYSNGTGWSSFEFTGPHSHDNHFYNITSLNSGHNALDLHGGHDYTVENMSAYYSVSNNFYVSGVQNVTLSNLSSYSPRYESTAFLIQKTGAENITLKDCYSYDGNTGINTGSINHFYVYNFTSELDDYGIVANVLTDGIPISNSTFIDCDTSKSKSHGLYLGTSINTTYINQKYLDLYWMNGYLPDVRLYYYADVVAKYANGSAVNATLEIENNRSVSSVDAAGNNKTSFSMSTGRTVFPSSVREASPTVLRLYPNLTTHTNLYAASNFTVSDGVTSIILNNIIPDARWYRSNISQSKYTITALINDSEDLHFTGYAPSTEYNTFENNSIVKMQVWANEPLTNVVWKVDGVEKQNSTSTIYDSTVGTAPITVDLIGSTATETISKTWVIDPTQTIDPEPEDPEDPETTKYPPVANFTSDKVNGTIPLKVNFTDSSTNATSWYWDIDNNGKTDYLTKNCTHTYRTQGNYTVKLTVSNSDGMNVTTKTEYIQAEKQSWYIIFWNWMFGFAGGVISG